MDCCFYLKELKDSEVLIKALETEEKYTATKQYLTSGFLLSRAYFFANKACC